MNAKNIIKWRNEINTIHKNSENIYHKMKKNNQKNHYIKYQSKNDNKYEKIINTENMRKFLIEKNVLMINTENTIQKNEKYDESFKNQNITLKKKNIIDISIYKIQKRQRCAFNHNVWTSK